MNKQIIKRLIALSATIVSIGWLIQHVDYSVFSRFIQDGSITWLLAGAVVYIGTLIARASRFRVLLPNTSVSFKELCLLTGIHNLAVRMLPNPAGDITFLYLAKKKNIDYASSLAALIVYRAFDFAVVAIFFLGFVLPFISILTYGQRIAIILGSIILAFGLILVVFLAGAGERPRRIAKSLVRRLPSKLHSLEEKFVLLFDAFEELRAQGVHTAAMLYSVLVWGLMFISYYMFFRAFGFEFGVSEVFLGGATQVFVNILPSIAGIGVMEVGWVAGLGFAGIEKAIAIAAGIGVDAATLVGTVLIAIWAFALEGGLTTVGNVFKKIRA